MHTTTIHPASWQYPLPCDKEQLCTMLQETLREGAARSAESGRAVLASITQPIERFDALHVFAGAGLAGFGARFFWERPSEQTALVGVGAAATIETTGSSRFATAAAAWRTLLHGAIINSKRGALTASNCGPVLFGGFAFDPLSPHTSLWEGFPDGLLILPRLLLSYTAAGATLTVNRLVRATDDSEYGVEQLTSDLARLWAAAEQTSVLQQETICYSNLLSTQDLLPASQWMKQVADTVELIRQGAYEKVVLARGLRVTANASETPFDVGAILHRLRQSYPAASIFAIERGKRLFVGATPERLVSVQDGRIQTMALAGSAPRGANEDEDRRLGDELLRSEKNKQEHGLVVERMREALATLCARVSVSEKPRLLRLKNIQHLETPIAGELLPGRSVLEVLEVLHPTPAVGGLPGPAALERIRACEQLDRGWYAGPVGWLDAHGNGEFAVALRSALLDGEQATLFAGCGIVADSDPQSEYEESCLKFQAMLRGLGGDESMGNASIESLGLSNPTYIYINAFVDELQRAGIRHVVICPGSRSTSLAMVCAAHPEMRVWMHVDERSAAYFGLGMAKRLGRPVALLCTSGTAAANFLPAIVEAKLSHVPLLVLTADRPGELRDNGAPQAIDQNRLYGTYVKWFVDVALPEASNEALRYIRTIASRAVALASAVTAGPVHLNFPFREPLTPEPLADRPPLPPALRDPFAWQGRPGKAPYVTVQDFPLAAPSPESLIHLAKLASTASRGLIVAGPNDNPALAEPIVQLARRLGYPILADPLSQLRCGSHDQVIASFDAFLRADSFVERAAPELVIRFGAMPTSKPLLLYLKRYASCPLIVIDGHGTWEEPTQFAAELVHADPTGFCWNLLAALEDIEHQTADSQAWLASWQRTDQVTQRTLEQTIQEFQLPFEGRVFTELARLLPDGTTLYVGNSMPVRDLDTFFWKSDRRIRIMANRGANGIDGVVSSALGASAMSEQGEPTVLVIGDLSFFHDLNGLLAARLHRLNLTIVLVNNDGGGIFSFLPQAAYPEYFEQLFGTPTGLDFRLAVQMYQGHFQSVETWEEFRQALLQGIDTGGLHVVEVPTERASNVSMHRQLWQAVAKALYDEE